MLLALGPAMGACRSAPARPASAERMDGALRAIEQMAPSSRTASTPLLTPISDALSAGWEEGEEVRFEELGLGKALIHEPQDAAVRRAKEDALAKAMRQAADVFYGFSDFSGQLGPQRLDWVARYLFTSSRGLLVDETTSKPECVVDDGVTTCRLMVRGKFVFKGKMDPAFQVLDSHFGRPRGLDRRQYFEGEAVRINLAVSKDAFVYIFSWDSQDNIFLVFPNRLQKDNRVLAGADVSIPSIGSGIAYRARLPKGAKSATESLLVVATKRELLSPEAASPPGAPHSEAVSMGKLTEMMRRLAELERSEWTMMVAPYEIHRRE